MCDKCEQYQTEISFLEGRVQELEEQLEPEDSFSHTRRTMMEDRD